MLHFWCFLCFASYERCLLDFSERLMSFWYTLACTNTFQFSITSHCCHMHETFFHEWSSIWWLASSTCMLFRYLNLSITIFMCDHSVMLIIYITMHWDSHSRSVARRWVWANVARTLSSLREHCAIGEGRLCLPLQKCAFLPRHYAQWLFCVFMRNSDCWPRKLCNAVIESATIASWDCTLRNSNS